MPPRIFISYRREDASGEAGRLADHMNRRFGRGQVFLDIDTIDPGTDFVKVLQSSLRETAAVLVVIGLRWASASDSGGARRLANAKDFVRLEVEESLGRDIPVVPVLVQGATMPRVEDLPPSLASLTTRQAVTLDHAEFHDDANRLCDHLEKMLGLDTASPLSAVKRWWPAAVVGLLAVGLTGYFAMRTPEQPSAGTSTDGARATNAVEATAAGTAKPEDIRNAEGLAATAEAQRRRNQYDDALASLAKARELAPSSATIREAQEDVAMEWIRNVRVENEKTTFGEAIKPALAVVDAALPSAMGQRRADLMAHQGWATFLLWRDGDRRLNPGETYREAIAIDPGNPYANAMLAHWRLFQDHDDVSAAVKLFDTAVRAGRALDAVRTLQWAAYSNASNPAADAERVRLADAMRRAGERVNMRQAQALWGPYYFATAPSREQERDALLAAVAPDDYISTLHWAFDDYAAKEEFRLRTLRYYTALLNAKAGRTNEATTELQALNKEMAQDGSTGSLRQAVLATLKQLRAR
ncbi:MAG TPA: toll/interleukin-1 receptor domain-containing protein [Vicinamibacterales bacterium]|nr:toll/interleukin-1 receptor domain-containing protein [Vicinamibacterales bacterium]